MTEQKCGICAELFKDGEVAVQAARLWTSNKTPAHLRRIEKFWAHAVCAFNWEAETPVTLFDIFVRAVAQTEDRQGLLGDDEIVFPPTPDFGYEWCAPRNALIFAAMGVDGVHYAILKIDGAVTDKSPVIHVSPMDFSEPYAVLGETFLDYLAVACAVTHSEMEALFTAERTCGEKLVPFLKAHFDHSRLYDETRLRSLDRYLKLIETKSQPGLPAV